MKNYKDSDYALNKFSDGIVYRFADQTVEVTLEDYLRENPDKTANDFAYLKALSDNDYFNRDRDDYRQTWRNVPLYGLEEAGVCTAPSPEDEVIEQPEQAVKQQQRHELAEQAMAKLTEIQKRRYLLYMVNDLTVREIAASEGVAFQVVDRSILSAKKKIQKFLGKNRISE